MRKFLTLALLFAPAALVAGQYDGRYRPDHDWAAGWDCKNIGMDGGALAIANDTFHGVESACSLTQPTGVRDMNATLYDMICRGEGEIWTSRIMIMSTQNGIAMIRDGGDVSFLKRCN